MTEQAAAFAADDPFAALEALGMSLPPEQRAVFADLLEQWFGMPADQRPSLAAVLNDWCDLHPGRGAVRDEHMLTATGNAVVIDGGLPVEIKAGITRVAPDCELAVAHPALFQVPPVGPSEPRQGASTGRAHVPLVIRDARAHSGRRRGRGRR